MHDKHVITIAMSIDMTIAMSLHKDGCKHVIPSHPLPFRLSSDGAALPPAGLSAAPPAAARVGGGGAAARVGGGGGAGAAGTGVSATPLPPPAPAMQRDRSSDVQQIFIETPKKKQGMVFNSTKGPAGHS